MPETYTFVCSMCGSVDQSPVKQSIDVVCNPCGDKMEAEDADFVSAQEETE